MDIFADYNNAVMDRLNNNEYLSGGVAAVVVGEDALEDDTDDGETAEEHRRSISDKLNAAGVVGILSAPELTRDEGDRFTLRSTLIWCINRKVNASATGAQKPGSQLVLKSVALLHRFRPQIYNEDDPPALANPYSMILVSKAERIGEDEGVDVWTIEFESRIAIATT